MSGAMGRRARERERVSHQVICSLLGRIRDEWMERGVELVERIFPARACGAVDREAGTGVRSRRRVLMIEVWG